MPHKLILFKRDDCPYCVNFKPVWDELKSKNELGLEYEEIDMHKLNELKKKAGGSRGSYSIVADPLFPMYAPYFDLSGSISGVPTVVGYLGDPFNPFIYDGTMDYVNLVDALRKEIVRLTAAASGTTPATPPAPGTKIDHTVFDTLLVSLIGQLDPKYTISGATATDKKAIKDILEGYARTHFSGGGSLEQSGGASRDNKNYKLKYYKYKAKYIKSKEN